MEMAAAPPHLTPTPIPHPHMPQSCSKQRKSSSENKSISMTGMGWCCVQVKKAFKGLKARKDLNIASRQHSQLLQQVSHLP